MADPIIIIDGVHKNFRLPHQKAGSVKNVFTNLFSLGNKSFETQHALKDITFDIKPGEFFGIVGRNGSGKSTLLKILAGIYQPSAGSVQVGGRVIPFIELGVGFNGELTGRENVYLNGALLGFSEKEIDGRYQDIVDFAELERFMDQKLKNYSSGMQVRLAFSVATRLAESDILLIDEVLAVGDADFQRKCFRYFKQLKKEHKTVVFVTHDMNAVREYCDRAAFVEKSELISVGTPEKVAKMYEKLLAPQAQAQGTDTEANRWGDGTLKITKPKVLTVDAKEISFTMNVTATADCPDPILGFVVHNGANVALLGTNTIIQKIKSTPMQKDEKREVTWSMPNILGDGDYTITLAASYDSGATIGDWWEDACIVRVTKTSRSPYLVAPDIKCSLKEIKA
jgi:ABC-2 type transport system ATP-binding protein